ncbi:putative awp1 protein [Neospora caninum Liverpool]|uniref:Awp1 protein, putative n=1 Tax=Neospora caninum (strain Liverpool) TaxID=572307 RepID=F0V8L3_NEOCL|nr:putative awp1 protein [Neospora caninum Liverpool]CBZ50054.1 putative awp1 protein [Neospora caninum Liverpool]CEL64648.1 TPA: awp1 protein, putative [Neospora caninum Liverpool]|eukprot:XP_003880089.1 putative awp1 protein [Neospora caninum Liverpool]
MATPLLRLLRSLEKWELLQDQCGTAVSEALNLIVDSQFLLGDYLVTLQTDGKAREKCLNGHERRIEAAHQQVLLRQRDLALTHAEIAECARLLGAASEAGRRRQTLGASRVLSGSVTHVTNQGKCTPFTASASRQTLSSPGSEALFLEEIGSFAAEAAEAYRRQLDLQNELVTLYGADSRFFAK